MARPDYRRPTSLASSLTDDRGDPGKLAYWEHKRDPRPVAEPEQDCEMFEVTGCGRKIMFCCHHPVARDSSGSQAKRTDTVECEQP